MLCSGIQYNTPRFQINPEMYGLQDIRNFLWVLYIKHNEINSVTNNPFNIFGSAFQDNLCKICLLLQASSFLCQIQ